MGFAGIGSLPADHHVAHHQQIHLLAQEAVERLCRGVDDGLVLVGRGVEPAGSSAPPMRTILPLIRSARDSPREHRRANGSAPVPLIGSKVLKATNLTGTRADL